MDHPFFEVDVFGSGPFSGNPLAVIAQADLLSTEQMRTIARWTNFSETTFLLQPTDPTADYRVRIFTPHDELPFAGHPTLGSARAWLEPGNKPAQDGLLVQECGAGLVPVRIVGERLAYATPDLTRTGPLDAADLDAAVAMLGISHDDVVAHGWGCNGPEWQLIQLRDADLVRSLAPRLGPALKLGVVGLEGGPGETLCEVRAFCEGYEDPVTGSLNGALAQWLRGRGVVPAQYVAAQGSQLGRSGRIQVSEEDGDIWIGGRADIRVAGMLTR